MADFDVDYSAFDDDVALDADSKKYTKTDQEWLKMTKGQLMRASLVYFHTVDVNAVIRAKRETKGMSPDQVRVVARKALETRATALGKTLDQLTTVDRLDLSEVKFKRLEAHYAEGLGYTVSKLGKEGPESDAVWRRLGDPKTYFTTLLLIYPTDQKGDIKPQPGETKETLVARLMEDIRLVPWRFGKGTFERLWKLNDGLKENNLSLHTQDLKLECKDAQYQNIDLSFVGAAIWQKTPEFRQRVLEQAIPLYDKLIPFSERSTQWVREKLGLASASGSSEVSVGGGSSDSFDDILKTV